MLLYCGYIGGDFYEKGGDIAVDQYGSSYITGRTSSSELTFPVQIGPDVTYNGNGDVFIAKVNAAGTGLEYCGYIGGENWDWGQGIKVDEKGNVFIAGVTSSTENDGFPVKIGPDLTFNGDCDVFVAKLNSKGTELEYCGYIGGDGEECVDQNADIAIDEDSNMYIIGYTYSDESSFPVIIGPQKKLKGSCDAFVAKVNSTGRLLDYCGYLGGDGWERGSGIAVDHDGNSYICGITSSTENSFPVLNGPDLTYNGGLVDGFIAKINSSGDRVEFCGYIGGLDRDGCEGIKLDVKGNVYITGTTFSDEKSFPVVVGPDLSGNGSCDAFVAKINTYDGISFSYCGFIGGSNGDLGSDIAVDSEGSLFVFGETSSDESNFPVMNGPDLTFNGNGDGFVAKVNSTGDSLEFCGYIGGAEREYSSSIDIDRLGNIYLMGDTNSDQSSFPVMVGPDLSYNDIYYRDIFVAKIFQKGLCCNKYELPITGGEIDFHLDAGLKNKGRKYLLIGALNDTNPGYPLPGNVLSLPFNIDNMTYTIMENMNNSIFNNFAGELDLNGRMRAKLMVPKIRPEFIGIQMFFAYCLINKFDFVSNPVPIIIVE